MNFVANLLFVACVAVEIGSEEIRLENGQIRLPMYNPDGSATSSDSDSRTVIVINNYPSMRNKLLNGSFPGNQIRTSTACPPTGFSKEYQQTVLNVHNNLRSLVATGRAKNAFYARSTGEYFPSAALMYKMIYNCKAEAIAHSLAKRCTDQASPYHIRIGWQENFQIVRDQPNVLAALKSALSTWKSEMFRHGLARPLLYSHEMRTTFVLTRFTKMIWGISQQIGCATHLCSGGFYSTVCVYRKFVNTLWTSIYPEGPTCTGCPPGTCDPNVGLCVWE